MNLDKKNITDSGVVAQGLVSLTFACMVLAPCGPAYAQEDVNEAEEIVVTLPPVVVEARRRVEDAQDAAVAVTVIGKEDIGLGQVDTLEDSAFKSPNTLYSDQGGPLSIRGVGSLGLAAGVDRQPAVGVFLDDVFIARPFGYPKHLNDIKRVEVVRGSQSTLYGKNTIGGAVNLVTNDPGKSWGTEAKGVISADREFDEPTVRLSTAFDAPFSRDGTGSDLGLRGYISWTKSGGYIENSDGNTVGDTNALGTKLTLQGSSGDDTDLRISLDYSRDRDDGGLWYTPVEDALDFKANHDYDPDNRLDIAGISARLDHDFGPVTMTSITALRGHEMETILDGDLSSASNWVQAQTESQRQVSQEIRLSRETDQFDLRGGLFYMHEWFEGDQFYDQVSVAKENWSRTDFDQDTDTVSAFAELTYNISPKWEAIGGLRYTYERKSATAETSSPSGTNFMGSPYRVADTMSFHNVSPEVSVVYHINDENLSYAKVSRGFKSGGISPFVDKGNQPNSYDPETTTTFELGAKTSWLDDRLRMNGAVFYTDWSDQQAETYITSTTRILTNAAQATSAGGELEAAYRMTENLSLNANYGFLHTEYEEFFDSVLGRNYSGNPLPFAPEHSAGLGVRYLIPLDGSIDMMTGMDYSYRSSYSFNAKNEYRQDATHLLDARVGLEGHGWSATLWAKNITDERYLKQYFAFNGTDMGVAAEGRTIGLTLAAEW